MPAGMSINIGLNRVDPAHYQGWDGALRGCEPDANDMRAIAEQQGLEVHSHLLSEEATAEAVTGAILDAATRLDSGDFLFLTYSGHGGQLDDLAGDESEGKDETWVLYDRELIDDELFDLWGAFAPGVRIFVLSDSCHSGTVLRARALRAYVHAAENEQRVKAVPSQVEAFTYRANRDLYDAIFAQHPRVSRDEIGAHLMLISGCRDEQLSADGNRNGLFTETLLRVWDGGGFDGDYAALHAGIVAQMPPDQTPQLFFAGADSPAFVAQRPFTV